MNVKNDGRIIPSFQGVLIDCEVGDMRITQESIEKFLSDASTQGKSRGTLELYSQSLQRFCGIVADSMTPEESVAAYNDYLKESGYALSTIQLYLSVVSVFFKHEGVECSRFARPQKTRKDPAKELTRPEYIRMLQTAKAQGKMLPYLLVKLFATTGMKLQDLPLVTVEAARSGKIPVKSKNYTTTRDISASLSAELLEYAAGKGIESGAVFRTRDNKQPISRVVVTAMIRSLCSDAGVDPEKGTPQGLKKLYKSTQTEIAGNINVFIKQSHLRLLESEQAAVGWDV